MRRFISGAVNKELKCSQIGAKTFISGNRIRCGCIKITAWDFMNVFFEHN